jgi:taurine--2-oxoglutarate transaminase
MNDFYYSWMRQDSAVDFPVAKAEADEFVLENGRRIYDFISTSFQANFGHSESSIQARIASQLATMPVASPKSTFALKQSVSSRLNELIDRGEGKIFYTVSGSEAVENALKIARQLTGRKIILARQKSYHGATLGALSVTGDWRNDPHVTFDEGTVRIPDHDEDPDGSMTRAIIDAHGANNIAALILETISGTNGMSVPTQKWFAAIQSLCRDHGIMLILDEVLVGFGRCGMDFAFHRYHLRPDLVTMSKAISGGYVPFGAVWTSGEIAKHYDENVLACGLTNYGHPLGLAALEAVLDLLDDESFQVQKRTNEKLFGDFLSGLAERHSSVVELRQRGLMAAIYLDRPAPSWQTAFDAGLHLYSKKNMSILAPPYNTDSERMLKALAKFSELLS